MGLPIDAVVEVTIIGDLFGQTTMNVFHYKVTTISTTVNPLTEVRDLINQHFVQPGGVISDAYQPAVPNELFIRNVTGQTVAPTRQRRVTALGIQTGGGGVSVTPNLQASITLQTDLAGRNQIGGKRIPMPSSQSSNGETTALYEASLDSLATACRTPLAVTLGGGVYAPVIYHRGKPVGLNSTVITAAFPQRQTRTIRRRTVGLGI